MSEEKAKTKGKFITKRRLKIYLPIFLVLAVIIGAVVIIKNLNGQSVGTVAPTNNAQISADAAQAVKPHTYNGKYVVFSYPAIYKPETDALSGSYLEVEHFISTGYQSKFISIGVITEQLSNDSSYSMRSQHPETYHVVKVTNGDPTFSSTSNGSELTSFVQHGDKVLSVSITALGGLDLTKDMQVILSSLHWK